MSSAPVQVNVEAWTGLTAAIAVACFAVTIGLTIWSWLSSRKLKRARRSQLTRARAP